MSTSPHIPGESRQGSHLTRGLAGQSGTQSGVGNGGREGDVFRLLYSSVAVMDLNREELAGLLERSRRNNTRDAVTGLLVHLHDLERGQAYFVQVLEGAQDVVEATYDRILTDELHRDVTLLVSGPTHTRAFSKWAMMLYALNAPEASQIVFDVDLKSALTVPPPRWISDLLRVEHLMDHLAARLASGASLPA